ncbi:AraC family transcriptional regulator [Marinobacter sp. CHS3-4]|uniref:helix-turn-helix transcriptional regulator n=1 Tax=Marinobacter sp. CHS3-4 TaxID=3045174 RepID=UPI0024B5EA77|nr:AraC family transcriptional regulator [Marinobacter sp. CHS3-4]MDI9243702.1 AraC family transcriptional regulator ligand-binding domain-containing protein [Marinobacter sp. CHS3-4]
MSAVVTGKQDLGLPAIYLHLLAELLERIGVNEQALLVRVGLDPARLNSMDLRVSQAQANEFVTRAVIESGEPGLGILLARELELPLHGELGTAVMSSRSIMDVMNLVTRFLSLRAPYLSVRSQQRKDQALFILTSGLEAGSLNQFVLDAVLFGFAFMGPQLTGTTASGARILRRGPEPAHFHRFRQSIPLPVEFNAAEDAFQIPVSELGSSIQFSNEQLAASSEAQCEAALSELTRDSGFACRVRRVIETSHPFPPKLSRVAGTLFVSERTLKRRLQGEGISFQTLVDEVRLQRARELLGKTSMNLGQIADALGYADAANFTRAFKRWTDQSPSQYRQQVMPPLSLCQ